MLLLTVHMDLIPLQPMLHVSCSMAARTLSWQVLQNIQSKLMRCTDKLLRTDT